MVRRWTFSGRGLVVFGLRTSVRLRVVVVFIDNNRSISMLLNRILIARGLLRVEFESWSCLLEGFVSMASAKGVLRG